MKCRVFISLLLLSFFSCKKEKNNSPVSAVSVETNVTEIYSDGLDELQITVRDQDNNDITSSSVVYIDGTAISGNIFTSSTAKTFTVKAIANGIESGTVSVTGKPHTVNRFSKKIILEEFAGSWCGYCPETTRIVDSAVAADNKIIPVQVHNGDPMAYVFEPQMRDRFGISSFPAVYLNRSFLWDKTASPLSTELNKKSKCGIAINTSVNGSNVNVTVKVSFDITTSIPLSLVVALLEDGIVSPQSNLYNNTPTSPFYNAGNPIQDYMHNNVLRKAATDIFGDNIPLAQQKKNNVYEKNFNINGASYDLGKSKVVAFVLFKENTASRFGVLNAQTVKAGMNKDFD